MKKLLNTTVVSFMISTLCGILLFLKLGISLFFVEMTILHILLVVLTVEDIKEQMISDKYILAILINSVLFRLISLELVDFLNGIITGLVIALLILLIKKVFKQNIGLGDMKLLAALSISFGYAGMVNILFYSVIIALLYGIVMMILKKKNKHSEIPFVPFISLGSLLTVISL